MEVTKCWRVQFLLFWLIFSCYGAFFLWNYVFTTHSTICHEPPFAEWTKKYIFWLVGAATGTTLSLWFRTFMAMHGFSDGKLRHPNATQLVLAIATLQASTIVGFYMDVTPYSCVDFLGVKTNPYLYFEWICTVPFMFFLTSIMDVKRNEVKSSDLSIEFYAGGSLVCLFLGNIPMPLWLNWIIFLTGNFWMTLALCWQQYDAYDEYALAVDEFNSAAKKESAEYIPKEIHDRLRVSQCKMNSSLFISLFFTIFPLLYYLRWFTYIDDDVFIVVTYICSFLAKVLFTQIISDSHVEILDPNKFLLVEEKKRGEESRLMFLRYVFHEVRVPLNSVALGLQLLQDSEGLSEQDQDTVKMMREATGFMAETLNDVLSLQKIEEGMLQLEYKPFASINLVKAVLTNFRAQYESKKIKVKFYLDPCVPQEVLGDQFRLEHVLGNLLSNAIKFSDVNSTIIVSVTYETKLKGHVTFAVRDQGPGMSTDDQKHLFQPFMQIRPGELQKGRGSGLGLSICKTIVALHNGSIGCQSKQRQGEDLISGGSEFYFSIEFNEPEVPTLQKTPEMENAIKEAMIPLNMQHHTTNLLKSSNSSSNRPSEANSNSGSPTNLTAINANITTTALGTSTAAQSNGNNNNKNKNNNNAAVQQLQSPLSQSRQIFVGDRDYIPIHDDAAPVKSSPLGNNTSRSPGTSKNNKKLSSNSSDDMKAASVDTATSKGNNTTASSAASTAQKASSTSVVQRILVCDDVLSNRKMLEMILRRKGFACDQCADGSEAVEIIQEKGIDYYDIILMDSVMPIMCGPEAAKKIRELGFPKLLIGVTGNAMDLDIVDYETAGADIILTKPMRIEALNKVIEFCNANGCLSHFTNRNLPPTSRVKHWVYNTSS